MNDFIAFPKLGLEFGISDTIVQFSLFGAQVSLKWYGLLIAAGFLLAVIYALRRAPQFELDPDRMLDVVLVSALFAFLGARLYYVVFSADFSEYLQNPVQILQIWRGGLAIYGGIIFAFATAIWMCRVRKVNTLAMFDIASLGFLIGQSIGRWGNFFNQEAFGGNTNLPWGMTGSVIQQGYDMQMEYDTALPVHPTFLYESLWCLIGFVLLHFFSKKAYKFKGQIFSLYIVWYGLGRFMIESLRTDSLMLGKTLRVSQLVAAVSILGGVALYFLLRARHNSLPADLFAQPADGEPADENGENTGAEEAGTEEADAPEDTGTAETGETDAPDGDSAEAGADETEEAAGLDGEQEAPADDTDASPADTPESAPEASETPDAPESAPENAESDGVDMP